MKRDRESKELNNRFAALGIESEWDEIFFSGVLTDKQDEVLRAWLAGEDEFSKVKEKYDTSLYPLVETVAELIRSVGREHEKYEIGYGLNPLSFITHNGIERSTWITANIDNNDGFSEYEFENLSKELDNSMSKLANREEVVTRLRFFEGMTLEAIGKEFCVKKERIRTIEAKALRRLRHSAKNLVPYFDILK
ncbi:MAG: sigma-70 family RNA polymerase sigma factor [Firmicutes bacterium]|nr:sigma-70 family RNA polymerase sigma factor [Bacillota bacterium]